jgi:hypothetical protein
MLSCFSFLAALRLKASRPGPTKGPSKTLERASPALVSPRVTDRNRGPASD